MMRRWNNMNVKRVCMNAGVMQSKTASKRRVSAWAFSWLLAFVLICTLTASLSLTAHAATDEEYTYTVRLFAGAHGTVNGGEVLVFENLKYGSPLPFSQRVVKLEDNSKYYIRGIRESGKDNSTTPTSDQLAEEYTVTGDQDYVVAYGVLGNAVAYTVEYVDADGNELAPTETYYGNIGDRPVVAFLYIEGYLPQAYNLTGTLRDNPADNVFRFTYEPLTPAAEGETPATTPETETPAATTPAATTPAGPAADVAAADAAAEAAGVTPPPTVQAIDDEVPLAQGGDGSNEGDGENQELMQLSDGQTPLGRGDFATLLLDLPAAAKAGIISILILLGAGGGYLYIRKKRMLEISIANTGNRGHDE